MSKLLEQKREKERELTEEKVADIIHQLREELEHRPTRLSVAAFLRRRAAELEQDEKAFPALKMLRYESEEKTDGSA